MEQLLVYGIILGSIIALGAIGLSLTYGILNFPNFAHGDMMALGAYLALFLHAGLHWPLTLAAAGAIVLTGVIAIGIDRAIYRRLRRTGPVSLLIASVGVALVVRYGIQLIWGPQTEVYIQGIQLPYRFDWLGGIRIKPSQIGILITAGLLVVAVHLLLTRTRLGKAMRALADNPELARVSGIPTERVIAWTWALGSGLAAAGGILLGIETFLRPPMGWNVLLPIVAAVILGGIGSAHGAMLGGMIIGVSQELSTAFLPTEYKPLIAFALLVAILIARPSGLAGVPAAGRGRV
ncbi:MAG TPA: branched-chain amino acid ABC transporter permease [Limnochordia bacterium]